MFSRGRCRVCGRVERDVSGFLGVCGSCAAEGSEEAMQLVREAHARSRRKFNLPEIPPRDPLGVRCSRCANECQISERGRGFCGLTENVNGSLVRLAGTSTRGVVEAYLDPHPTNCVASWVCAGGTGAGYPKYSVARGAETGFYNLAVFYGACSYDCLFCQNWHYRGMVTKGPHTTARELASLVNDRVTCICFFGGDPTPQIEHALETARIAKEERKGILRVCLETNCNMNIRWLREMSKISLESGGGIKVDLKAWTESLHIALTGVSNIRSLENVKELGRMHGERREVPFLRVSTLLVPGYITPEEVGEIANHIADIDVEIPYSLLAYSPQFEMRDLPHTSLKLAIECKRMAEDAGLEKVRIGNKFLLRPY